MLRIEKDSDGRRTILRLSGRIEAQHLVELTEQIENSVWPVALDLAELKLVDLEAVRYLALVERRGIELRSCPGFIREWIRRERGRLQE